MGLLVFVYRNKLGDSTNGGLSAKHDVLTVVNVDGPFDPCDRNPAVMIVENRYGKKLVPCTFDEQTKTWTPQGGMMGGNFAGTSDSRWHSAVSDGGMRELLPIFDRFEG